LPSSSEQRSESAFSSSAAIFRRAPGGCSSTAATRRRKIVGEIEKEVEEETGEKLSEPDDSIRIRQRERIPLREIASTAFSKYPKRSILGLSLFVGQAFLYNAVTFDLGTLLGEFFGVASGAIPLYIAVFAISNFLGPLTLGRLFDTVGRRPMITATYLGSALVTALLGVFLLGGGLTTWTFMAFILVIFFIPSAGASSAYLTVSEIFPMESRALSIAFFYAVGTAIGGITGPLLFGHLIATGSQDQVAIGFFIGAVMMAIGGIAELAFGVDAEQKSLEEIAPPLTAVDEGDGEPHPDEGGVPAAVPPPRPGRRIRFGPGQTTRFRGMPISVPRQIPPTNGELEGIEHAVAERPSTGRPDLARAVRARNWGPGRFSAALGQAVAEGRVRRIGRGRYEPVSTRKP
jgi:hypothetical protein